jgi:hypothetical protein
MLRREIAARCGAAAVQTFQFHAPRCDRVVGAVMDRLHRVAGEFPPRPAEA